MALALVAESAASIVIEKVINTALSYDEECGGPSNMQDEIQRLQQALPQIQAISAAVEGMQNVSTEQNKVLDAWLWQLRDAAERAEDVFDELEYYKLEKRVQARGGSVLNFKRKFTDFAKNMFGNDTLNRLREAVKALDKVAATVGPFLQLASQLYDSNVRCRQEDELRNARATSSFLTESIIYGRDEERDVIVGWLTKPTRDKLENTSAAAGNVSVFAIVGMGGMGKTALTQFVYHDKRVQRCFDLVMWVCVSDRFDAAMLTVKILEAAMVRDSLGDKSLNTIQEILKEKLISKKFLLVLDDVWNDNKILEWDKLVAPLKFGRKGSKILLTTRMDSVANAVARVLQGRKESLKLSGLKEDDFILLFNKHAFAGANIDDHRNLELIGQQIAKKLGGCPLAAKILGGCLNSCMDEKYWRRILNENFLNLQESEDNIRMILRLSYQQLPISSQICFRYCSIFPKDHEFEKNELIYLWIGSGLIKQPTHEKRSLEDIGEEYLNHLARRSLFDIKISEGAFGLKQSYVMHDLLHDLAQFASLGECLRIEGDGSREIPKTIRHIYVKRVNPLMISHLKNLRTLFIHLNKDYDVIVFNEVLKKLKSLRLLQVTADNYKLLDEVGNLIHLRYLSLTPWIDEVFKRYSLPQSICGLQSVCRLYHLEVMKLPATKTEIDDSALVGMSNLVKLRMLDIPARVTAKIPWIGKVTLLQNLDYFYVREECSYKICQLKNLRNLRKLCIDGLQNVRSPQEAIDANLIEKENLDKLSLVWPKNRAGRLEVDGPLLDNLKPHTNLKELEIKGYAGVRSPHWMTAPSLSNITSINLHDCKRWENLSPFGQLPLLKFLCLRHMPAIRKLSCSSRVGGCAFPSLKELKLYDMPNLELFEGEHLFPHLNKFDISSCPSLKGLPALPLTLNQLDIWTVGMTSLPMMQQDCGRGEGRVSCSPSHPALSYLRIGKCPNLTSLDGFILQQQYFPALASLSIKECKNLRLLPKFFFQKLPSLKYLITEMCPNLTTHRILDNRFPETLEKLTLESSGDLGLSLVEAPILAFLTDLKIDGCASITSFPPAEVLPRLMNLYIRNCKELSSLDGLHALPSLESLYIGGCDKLIELSLMQPPIGLDMVSRPSIELRALEIDQQALLLIEPLRSLNSVCSFIIQDGAELTSSTETWLLQNQNSLQILKICKALSLQSFPPILMHLRSLCALSIYDAPLLQSIPELPATMEFLTITGCQPELKEYIKGSGKFANVPYVRITED
ncbi:putative disease resistance protein At3g14460 [Ananas comosus]|uniref:Disease resistance protein At3g14460 n=1 Tax=Ananas comosus TaxID=4615 RepID=A0A6P5FGM4_ANACO|nr:putative disease resistance protein At3g14460 [Ananas comosus]